MKFRTIFNSHDIFKTILKTVSGFFIGESLQDINKIEQNNRDIILTYFQSHYRTK